MSHNTKRRPRPLTIEELDIIESGDFRKDFESSSKGGTTGTQDSSKKCSAQSGCSLCPCMRKSP